MNPGYVWMIAGLVLLFLEFVIPGVILVFFGIGAILTAAGYWFGLLPSLAAQLSCFCIVSLLSLFTLRKYFSRFLKGKVADTNEFSNAAEFIGKTAKVTTEVTPDDDRGRVDFDGSDWKATSDSKIEVGQVVKIIEMKNITFKVKPIQ